MTFSRRVMFRRAIVAASATILTPTILGPARGRGNGTAVTAKTRSADISREAALLDKPRPAMPEYNVPTVGYRYLSPGFYESTIDRVDVTAFGDMDRRYIYPKRTLSAAGVVGLKAEYQRQWKGPQRDPRTGRFTKA